MLTKKMFKKIATKDGFSIYTATKGSNKDYTCIGIKHPKHKDLFIAVPLLDMGESGRTRPLMVDQVKRGIEAHNWQTAVMDLMEMVRKEWGIGVKGTLAKLPTELKRPGRKMFANEDSRIARSKIKWIQRMITLECDGLCMDNLEDRRAMAKWIYENI